MKIVLDTNCLLPAVFPRSIYHWLWKSFLQGDFILCISNEVITEYEELLSNLYPLEISQNTIHLLLTSTNTQKVIPFYKWNLITADPEDNKFVDCAFIAGADFIVTNDKHFNILKEIEFPKFNVIDIDSFKTLII